MTVLEDSAPKIFENPTAGLVGAAVALLVIALVSWSKDRSTDDTQTRTAAPDDRVSVESMTYRPRRVLLVVFGTFFVVVMELFCFVPRAQLWLWFLAILPATLVVHHGIQLAVFKNRRFFDDTQSPRLPSSDHATVSIVRAAMKEERQYYGTPSLALRFALPALVLVSANLAIGYSLSDPPQWGPYQPDPKFLGGAQVAALGAYLYVLLLLGGRTLKGDITPSSVWWSCVTMAAGSILGGILSVMFIGKNMEALLQPAEPAAGQDKVSVWSTLLLPFAAGFSLRYIVSVINEVIRRVIGGRAGIAPRTVPLTQLRGIDQDIEERLAEEGIIDVSGLAMANPTKLRRNTRFDKRQILSWIDEALLITFLPSSWRSLEDDGVTGAIDLVWYACFLKRADLYKPMDESKERQHSAIVALAQRNKISEASLIDAIFRMKEDAQVALVRGLYQLDDTESMEGTEHDPFEVFSAEFQESTRRPLENGNAKDAPDPSNGASAIAAPAPPRFSTERAHGLFLIHSWRRSRQEGQRADVVIRVRHVDQTSEPSARPETPATPPDPPAPASSVPTPNRPIKSVEYWLGPTVSPSGIVKDTAGDEFRLDVSLRRPRLCVAEVTFVDGSSPIRLERYLDFDTTDAD